MLPALILCIAGTLGSSGIAAALSLSPIHMARADKSPSRDGKIEAFGVVQCGQTHIKWDWPLNSQAGPNYIVEVIPAGNSTAPPIVGPISVWSANWTTPALPIIHDATIQFKVTGPDSKTIISDPYVVEKCSRCDCELRDSRAAVAATPSITPVNAKRKGPPIGALVGGIVGGVCGIALLGALLYLCCRRRRRAARPASEVQARITQRRSRHASTMSTNPQDASFISDKRASHVSSKHMSVAESQNYYDNSVSRSSRYLLPPPMEKRASSQSLASIASGSSRYSTQQMLLLAMQKAEARKSGMPERDSSYTSDIPGGRGLADYRGPRHSRSSHGPSKTQPSASDPDTTQQTATHLAAAHSQPVGVDGDSPQTACDVSATEAPPGDAHTNLSDLSVQHPISNADLTERPQVDTAPNRPSSERSSLSWHSATDPFETPVPESSPPDSVTPADSTVGMAL